MDLAEDACYRAILTRDRRFDGAVHLWAALTPGASPSADAEAADGYRVA